MTMHEIICPHCGKAFKIDEAGYADILKQVRDADFEKQLHERLELAERDKQNAVELAQAKVTSELQKAASAKDAEIQALKARLDAGEVAQKLAVSEALSAVEKDRDALANALEKAKQENETKAQLAEAKRLSELQQAEATKDAEIQRLQAKLAAGEVAQKLALTEAVSVVAKERDELKSGLDRAALEKQLAETALKDKYETQLKDRDGEIVRLRDMKARLSTKMIGKPWSSIARLSLTVSGRPHSQRPTSKKTTTCAPAARATTSSGTWMIQAPRSSRSCSR
jgi:hypothetical protein